MNVLILGGNGYLGSKVTRQIIELGHNVVLTKRSTSDLSRLSDVSQSIKWIPASIEAVIASMEYMQFDYVVNMACNYGRSTLLYDDVIEANIEFPLKVLNATVKNGTKHFITIGTGLPDELNMYSFSKKILGEFGRFYAEQHGVNFNNLLLEMFYGYDEPQSRFLPSVIIRCLNGETVDMTEGIQKRDIISVKDIVDAIMLVFNNSLTGYNVIPIGTGIAPSIAEIVDYIWKETGKKSKINKGTVMMRKNEPDCVADTTFIKSLGTWQPVYWKIGIAQMINDLERIKNENFN